MGFNTAQWKQYGELIQIEGNLPLSLSEPDKVYIISSGRAEVFCVQKFNNETYGTRNHLFSVSEGNAVFCFGAAGRDTITYEVQLIGIMETEIIELKANTFFALGKLSEFREELVHRTEEWIRRISGCISDTLLPKNATVIRSNGEMAIAGGTPYHTISGVLWAAHMEGSSEYMGLREYVLKSREVYFPLTENSWLTAVEDIRMDLKNTSDMLEQELLYQMLMNYNDTAFDMIQLRIDLYRSLEKQRLSDKIKNDAEYINKAILSLANVLETSEHEVIHEVSEEDNLFRACYLVGKSKGISIIKPVTKQEKTSSKDVISNIARASRIRFRSIILQGEWWNKDNGAMLGFLGEERKPVALLPVAPDKYELLNPESGERTLIQRELASQLNPRAFVFYRTLPFRQLGLKDILKFGLEGTWKRDLIFLILLGIGGGLLGMTLPIISGILFDTVIPQGEREYLWQVAIFLFAGVISGVSLQVVRSFVMMRLETRMDTDIQAAIWDRLISLPVAFFKDYSAGELSMKAMSVNKIKKALSGTTITAILTGLFSVFNLGLLFYYSAKLAMIAVLIIIASVAAAFLSYRKVRYEGNITNQSNKLSGFVLQLMEGIPKLKIAGAESRAFYLWSKKFSGIRKVSLRSVTISNLIDSYNNMLPVLSSAVIFFFYISAGKEQLSAGRFIAFNAAFVSFFATMVTLSTTLIEALAILPLCRSISPILKALPEYDEDKLDPGELNGQIEVSNISFRYKEGMPLVIKNASFQINPGEYVAIVGPSGCGKSTLLRILLGFEKPEAGCLYYDGQDMDKVDIRGIRRQIGVVLQNGKLLPGDIFTNIVGSNPQLTIDDAWEAAKASGLEEDINNMPMGMHTVISEGTSTLSGGQRQRLLIARAIVNKPRIVFFDEATSALDNKTQKIVSDSLDKIRATRIVIAHRLSTIINCDRIIVMDKGHIIEIGPYEELIAKKGVFYEMAQRQLA